MCNLRKHVDNISHTTDDNREAKLAIYRSIIIIYFSTTPYEHNNIIKLVCIDQKPYVTLTRVIMDEQVFILITFINSKEHS